jgi:SecD/SecF fusion protein
MGAESTFLYALMLMILFGWYLATDIDRRKRILGSVLTVLLVAFCLEQVYPPFDVRIPTGTEYTDALFKKLDTNGDEFVDLDEFMAGQTGQKDPAKAREIFKKKDMNGDGKLGLDEFKTEIRVGKISLGLDLKGGTSFLIQLVAEPSEVTDKDGKKHIETKSVTKSQVDQAVEVIRKRVDKFGVSEPIITPEGSDRILVQIPGLDPAQIAEAREQLQKVAKLEFCLVHPDNSTLVRQIEAATGGVPGGYRMVVYKDDRDGKTFEEKLLIHKTPDLLGTNVAHAYAGFGGKGWEVDLQFDSVGAKQFDDLADKHFGERFAILLDGVVQSAPTIQAHFFGGHASISGGHMGEKEARNLASVLENPLQTPVKIIEERNASATLGSDSIRSGVVAGIGGLVLVLIFVAIYYHFAGLVAIVGLIVNMVVLAGTMAMFHFTLTLPGIAGVILTIGLSVDANVLIYERLREEMAHGKSLAASITAAYDKAFSVIFDANATTLITAGILFWQASGPVKGFAVTLTLGIIASVFSAMVVTRNVFSWALAGGVIRRISMLHLISPEKQYDFLGKRRLWIGISLTVIVISIAGFAAQYPNNLGIDFRGGDVLRVEPTGESVTEAAVRDQLKPLGLGDVVIQKEHDRASNKDLISIRSPIDTSEKIKEQLFKTMPQAGFQVRQQDKVGSLVGGELARSSLIALGLGMLGILIFVTFRFEFSFALGALVALLHDVIITTGLFSLTGRELSLIMVGAILTIAGYSINDTIVVYDRIREGLRSGRKGTIQSIMNASINETLSRTLLTSGCTLLSVAALFFFGGPVLHDFAFAILIGIVVGTYSSIFIAAPIVLWWTGHKGQGLQAEVKRTQAATA